MLEIKCINAEQVMFGIEGELSRLKSKLKKKDYHLAQFHSMLGQKQGYIDQLTSQVRNLQNDNIDRDKEYWELRLKVVEYNMKNTRALMVSKGKSHASSEETSEPTKSESTKSEEIRFTGKKRTESHKYRERVRLEKSSSPNTGTYIDLGRDARMVSLDDLGEIKGTCSNVNSRDETKAENQ